MSWVVDIVLAGIILIAVLVGIKRGIAKMIVSLVGTVLAVVIATSLAAPAAGLIYQKCFESRISASVDGVVQQYTVGQTDEAIDALFADNGTFSHLAGTLKLTADDVKAKVPTGGVQTLSDTLKNDIIKPPLVAIIKIIALVVLLILLISLVAVVSRLVSRAVKATPLSGLNRFFGGVTGLFIGLALAAVLCSGMDSLLTLMPRGFWGIDEISRDNSVLYRLISQLLGLLRF